MCCKVHMKEKPCNIFHENKNGVLFYSLSSAKESGIVGLGPAPVQREFDVPLGSSVIFLPQPFPFGFCAHYSFLFNLFHSYFGVEGRVSGLCCSCAWPVPKVTIQSNLFLGYLSLWTKELREFTKY